MTRAEPELLPGVAGKLDRYVTRIVAPNAGVMTGPGTNTYLVGEQELAVIDPGPEDAGHVRAILAAAGARPIRWILCSHTHLDHASSAATLRTATGAKVAAMARVLSAPVSADRTLLDGGSGGPAPAAERGYVTPTTTPFAEHDVKLVLDQPLADGDTVEFDGLSLRAVHTPGHASNHLCFLLLATGMLFTGDHIMQGSTVVIGPPGGNMRAYLQSLRRLLDLEIAVLAPGHGYLIHDPHAEATRLVEHRLHRESKVRQALLEAGGTAPLATLLPRVYNDVSQALHPIAAKSLQAHLDKLVEDGDVRHVGGSYVSVTRSS